MMHTPIKVVHNYVDRAQEADPAPPASDAPRGGATGANGQTPADHNFPTKLHYMLSSVEGDNQSHIVSWQPHGRCFMVHNLKEFVASMLPLWFRQSKYASFQRQLNLYGFQRLTQGRDKGAYYHEYFLRGRPLLAQNITRTKVKGKGARKSSSPDTEPRLYEYAWVGSEAQKAAAGAGTATAGQSMMMPAHHQHPALLPARVGGSALAPDPTGFPLDPLWSAPPVSWTPSPAFNLGDALSFFRYDQPQALTTQQQPQFYGGQHGHEQMMLPCPPFSQDSSSALISSLISNSGSSTSSNPNSGTTTPSTITGASTQYVPIAPAPPNYKSNIGALATKTSIDPPISTLDENHSVLAAMKAQHIAPSPPVVEQTSACTQSTRYQPGPAPYLND